MHMECNENGALYVWLTAQDAARIGLTGTLPMGGSVRGALRQILRAAREKTAFSPAGSLSLEVLANGSGYLLIFTPVDVPAHERRPERAAPPRVFRLRDSDRLLQLAQALGRVAEVPSASLYRLPDGFYLLLYTSVPEALSRLLREMAEPTGEGDACMAYIEEYGRACCIGDALARLKSSYSF